MNWELLLDEAALAPLFPGEYAQFVRPVKEGLMVFLSGLPKKIQKSILAEQAALPANAPLSLRLGQLARSCPVLHKLAQVLARDCRLAPELREHFRELESLPPAVELATIQELLKCELGPLSKRSITLTLPAIAEASVAVVIPFQHTYRGRIRDGVFKILKPAIEERMFLELELLGSVGCYLDAECNKLGIPQLRYRETFDQIRQKLANEVQLEHEQSHLIQARSVYALEPEVQIPEVYSQHCTPRVTAMERVFGEKVTDHSLQCPWETRRLANLVARALIVHPVLARSKRALIHGDPHAGNLLYTDDGRLAILDWSLVGHLGDRDRIAISQILLAACTYQADRIVELLSSMAGPHHAKMGVLQQVVESWLRRLRQGRRLGLSWLVGLMDEATQAAGLRVSDDMLLFRKSLLTLEGVVGDVGASGHWIDDVASREFFWCFITELPGRFFTRPDSRAFSTRLSNLDLLNAFGSLPLTAARYWLAEWWDLLQNRASAVNLNT